MRIAICDSDDQERNHYFDVFRMLADVHKVVVEFDLYISCEEMLFHFENQEFMDVLFLQTEMPGMSGMEAAERLRLLGYQGEIIFLTTQADMQTLLSGFDVNALHFMIQNEITPAKTEEIFLRARDKAELKHQKYILFTAANEWINIPMSGIKYFEIYKKMVSVYYGYGEERFEFYAQSFESIEKQLIDNEFVRIHRSFLVSVKEIKSITYHKVTIRNGTELPLGRTYLPSVRETLKNFNQIHTVL